MMNEQEQRQAVVAEARTWCGTPYHHAAHVKGAGVDCLYLLVEVYKAAGLIGEVDIPYYPSDIMLHRNEETYLNGVKQFAHQVDAPSPGDIALWRFGRIYSHAAIVVDWPTVIHAHREERMVTIGNGAIGSFDGRDVMFFSIWPKECA